MSQVDGRSHQSSNARTHARLHSKFQRLLPVRVCLSFRARSWLETKGQEGVGGTEGVGEPLRKGTASGFEPIRSGFEPEGLSGTGKGTGIGWYRPGGGADADVPSKDAMWGQTMQEGSSKEIRAGKGRRVSTPPGPPDHEREDGRTKIQPGEGARERMRRRDHQPLLPINQARGR